MKSVARSIVYWPGIDEEIQHFVRRCSICASAAKSPPQIQPQPWPKAEGPWKRIHLDYAGPIDGMSYLVVVDSFSKWPEIFQTRSTTATTTIGFLRETFARYGVPDTIVSDNGSQFCSSEFQQFCEYSGIIHVRTAPYHPQSNGQAERFVDTLKRSLRKITEGENVPSSEALQTFLQVYRSTPSTVLEGKSPAEIMFGRPMKITLDLLRPSRTPQRQPPSAVQPSPVSSLTAGALVYAKVHKNADNWKWQPGTIIEVIGKVNFNVLLDQASGPRKLIRVHANQIRARYDEVKQQLHQVPLPLEVLIDNFGLSTQAPPSPAPTTVSSPSQAVPVDDSSDSLDDTMRTATPTIFASTPSTPATIREVPQRNDEITPRPVRCSRLPRRLEDYIRY